MGARHPKSCKNGKEIFMYQKIKRILALAAVLIIAALYLAVVILALTGGSKTRELLAAAIAATVVLPVLLYIYMWLFRVFGKKDAEDPDGLQ